MEICTIRRRINTLWLAPAIWLCLNCSGCSVDKGRAPDSSTQPAAAPSQTDVVRQLPPDVGEVDSRTPHDEGISSGTGSAMGVSDYLYLAAESRFVLNGGISSQSAEHLLHSSRNMTDAIDQLSQEAASRPEALALTAHYRSSLSHTMGQTTVLERLSCGLSICVGIARARSEADHAAWSSRFANTTSSPTYSFAEASESVAGGYENRFIFSTDPALNAISGN